MSEFSRPGFYPKLLTRLNKAGDERVSNLRSVLETTPPRDMDSVREIFDCQVPTHVYRYRSSIPLFRKELLSFDLLGCGTGGVTETTLTTLFYH